MAEILFLAHRVPWPPDRGDKIRSHHVLRKLAEHADVHLLCFGDEAEVRQHSDGLREQLASVKAVARRKPVWWAGLEALASGQPVSITSFASRELHRSARALLADRQIECIFVFSGQMAQYAPAEYAGRLVMDFVDVDSAKFESYAATGKGPMAWINRREGRLLSQFEQGIARRADHSLFVSEAEAEMFRDRIGQDLPAISAMGNGIAITPYAPRHLGDTERAGEGPLIVFTGQMDYRPNVEAVIGFVCDAMPRIRAALPEARFAIVGRDPVKQVRDLDGQEGAFVTGPVDDVRDWLYRADVVVAPLKIARGVQNKVLEAMAMAKAVVASSAAAEGLDVLADEHLVIADDPDEQAQAVLALLHDPAAASNLGLRARQLVSTSYGWDRQLQDLPAICGVGAAHWQEAAE